MAPAIPRPPVLPSAQRWTCPQSAKSLLARPHLLQRSFLRTRSVNTVRASSSTALVRTHAGWGCRTAAWRRGQWSSQRRAQCPAALQIDNRELLVGDCLAIVSFCLYKQITSLLFLPDFPGWTAPLHFNPIRFEELAIFCITLCVCWIGACGVVGGYRTGATANLPTALARVSGAWLIAMPVAACNLILVTAVEDKALVGDPLFGHVLPLAARGPGEPFVTAAGLLGLMAVWRAFYTCYLDFWSSRTFGNRYRDMCLFMDSLRSAFLMCIVFNIALQYFMRVVGEENIESAIDAMLRSAVPF